MNETKRAILEAVEKYVNIAKSKGYVVPHIPIDFSLTGACAGQAISKRLTGYPVKMRFNVSLAERHLKEFCERTVPHELAHILQYMSHPTSKPHGKEWQHFCKILTGSTMERCHQYDTKGIKRTKNVKRYLYRCSCQTHKVSTTVHNRISNGQTYTCKNCKSRIESIAYNFK